MLMFDTKYPSYRNAYATTSTLAITQELSSASTVLLDGIHETRTAQQSSQRICYKSNKKAYEGPEKLILQI